MIITGKYSYYEKILRIKEQKHIGILGQMHTKYKNNQWFFCQNLMMKGKLYFYFNDIDVR